MYIGEVSNKTGVSVKTIRFYEELGLLTDVRRSGRYRVYDDSHILIINLIVQAKQLGFKLAELKQAVAATKVQEPWLKILEMIEQKQRSLSEEIQSMQHQIETLSNYRHQIQSCLSVNPQCKLKDSV